MPSPDVQHPAEIATPHDLLLTGSALGVASGMMPDTSWARFGLNLARRPGVVAERVGSFGRELASIATGTSDRAPAKPDKRFSDPAWQGNPLMKRSMQAYLAAAEVVDNLFADAELDWRDAERIRFVLDVVMEGLAPSNNPLISPLGWKAIIDTGGLSVVRGVRRFLQRYGCAAADSVDGGARRVHGRRGSRRHAGSGRVPQRGVRTHPVHTSNREGVDGAAADGAAGDQQVLHLGHRPGSEHGGVPPAPGPSGFRHLVAQSNCSATVLGL